MALVRRGLPIDHPVPEVGKEDTQETDEGNDTASSMPPPGHGGVSSSADTAASASDSNPKPAKKRKLAGTGSDAAQNNDVENPGVATSELPSPLVSVHSHVRYYRKVHRVLTYGLAYRTLAFKLAATGTTRTGYVLSTPLCEIPWDRLFMYLNTAEFINLPNSSVVSKVKCSVRTRNVRVAFPTNSSESNLATLNQNKSLVYALGLNVTATTMPLKYSAFQDTQPMIPTSFDTIDDADYKGITQNMYGKSDDFDVVPRHQVGIPQVFPIYCGMVYAPFDKGTVSDGWECLQALVTETLAVDTESQELVTAEYQPAQGLCTDQYPAKWYGLPQALVNTGSATVDLPYGPTEVAPSKKTVQLNTGSVATKYSTSIQTQTNNGYFGIIQKIERSQEIWHGLYNQEHPRVQPSLHVGVQPTVALSTKTLINDDSNSSFTDTQGYFDIVCEMEINTKYPIYRPHLSSPVAGEGDFYTMNSSTRDAFPTFAGLYQM